MNTESTFAQIARINDMKRLVRSMKMEFLRQAFEMREEWSVPQCLRVLFYNTYDACSESIWCDYNHDGAWVVPFSVRLKHDHEYNMEFVVDGRERGEYCDDWTDGNTVYDEDGVFKFVEHIINAIDPALADLCMRIQGCTTEEEDIECVLEWIDDYCYEDIAYDDEDYLEIAKWAQENVGYNAMTAYVVTLKTKTHGYVVTKTGDSLEEAMERVWHSPEVMEDEQVMREIERGWATIDVMEPDRTIYRRALTQEFVVYAHAAYDHGRKLDTDIKNYLICVCEMK